MKKACTKSGPFRCAPSTEIDGSSAVVAAGENELVELDGLVLMVAALVVARCVFDAVHSPSRRSFGQRPGAQPSVSNCGLRLLYAACKPSTAFSGAFPIDD